MKLKALLLPAILAACCPDFPTLLPFGWRRAATKHGRVSSIITNRHKRGHQKEESLIMGRAAAGVKDVR